MKIIGLLAGIGGAVLAAAFPLCAVSQHAPPLSLKALFDPRYQRWIEKHPDQFSWMVFALICKQAPANMQIVRADSTGKSNLTNNSIWETWADDDFTFPQSPNPRDVPGWRNRHEDKHFVVDPLMALTIHASVRELEGERADFLNPIPPIPNPQNEEVRRNYAAFESITTQGLWYQEGIARWVQAHSNRELRFSRGSIEIKAVWQRMPDGSTDTTLPYHANYDQYGHRYRLRGLHIMTNALPQWTWATWEWVGNGGLQCDEIKCNDDFGFDSKASAASRHAVPTQVVLQMFSSLGVKDEWAGYRLRGSQILRDGRPDPDRLGNSNMEESFLPTSSCVSCHRQARVDPRNGKADCKMGFIDNNPGHQVGTTVYQSNIPPTATSFIWAFIKASSVSSGKRACP